VRLKNLSSKFWKAMHMLVYVAYASIIRHVATGPLQYEKHRINWIILIGGFYDSSDTTHNGELEREG